MRWEISLFCPHLPEYPRTFFLFLCTQRIPDLIVFGLISEDSACHITMGWVHSPCWSAEFLLIFLHILIQLVQIDIGEDGTDARPLWSAGVGFVVFPLFHISGFQKFPHQADKGFVLDSPAENFNQYMVVKAVETRLDIALHKPLCASERVLNFDQRGVAAFSRAESMRYIGKGRS